MKKDILLLEKDIEVEKKEWPILRIGWILMGLFVLGGALGVFGDGVLSRSELKTQNVLIKYDRLLRYSLDSKITISATSLNPDSSLLINSAYNDKIQIEEISPEPTSMKQEGNKIRVKFGSLNSKNIIFYINPIGRGNQDLEIEINRQTIRLKQFIFF